MKKSLIAGAGVAALAMAAVPFVGVFADPQATDTIEITVNTSCTFTAGAGTATYAASGANGASVSPTSGSSNEHSFTVFCNDNDGYTVSATATALNQSPAISDSFAYAYNAVVLAMVRYYREMGEVIPLKIALVSKLKEGAVMRRFYTFEEVERVVREADFETGLMIKVMFETGMRIAELARLKVADFTGRRVRFLAKGRKMREAYVRKETWREVCKLASQRGITGDKCLFGGTLNGEPLTTATVRRRLEMAFSAVGFKGFYPHSLRHSFATHLQLKGASVAEIKEMIGHESVATTERYLHGFEGRLEELFDRYLG